MGPVHTAHHGAARLAFVRKHQNCPIRALFSSGMTSGSYSAQSGDAVEEILLCLGVSDGLGGHILGGLNRSPHLPSSQDDTQS